MILGKGKAGATSPNVTEIAVESIAPNPQEPRQEIDETHLRQLTASIREHGLLQPVIVRPVGNAFELVIGEGRLRAARLAGLQKVPAVVKDITAREAAGLALVEDLQRPGLSVIEEARGYRRLLEEYGLTQSEIGRLVGKSQSTIANKLRLLRLPDLVQSRILNEGVSERHARALLDLADEAQQTRMLEEVQRRGLSVRETEEKVRALKPRGEVSGGSEDKGGRGLLFDWANGPTPDHLRGSTRRGATGLRQVSDRRAIRAFRDIRLFLNTFRRTFEMLKEAGIRAEMVERDDPDFLEVKVIIPKAGVAGPQARTPAGTSGSTPTGVGLAETKRDREEPSPGRGD